jgi:two-component system NtrC family sensor kinase
VLNSVNISASIVDTRLRTSRVTNLRRVVGLIEQHGDNLGHFLSENEKGRLIPRYLSALSTDIERERVDIFAELDALKLNIDHIKHIVSSQQPLARSTSALEEIDPTSVMEDALRINGAALQQHGIQIERRFGQVAAITADRHQIVQVLVNFVSNAVRSLVEHAAGDKTLVVTIGTEGADGDRIRWQVQDNGVGIPAENLTRIFQFGFTTKRQGRGGLGLHTAALAANLMAGSLHVHSDGIGRGATFYLELPAHAGPKDTQRGPLGLVA